MDLSQTTVERFHRSYTKAGKNDCWFWRSSTNGSYGILLTSLPKRKARWEGLAHRIAYSLCTGEKLTRNDVIRHTCDNTLCVNPKHLRRGTQKDNIRDMIAKGRKAVTPLKGELNGRAKLTAKQVCEIRSSLLTHQELSGRFKVSETTIRMVKKRILWKHLP